MTHVENGQPHLLLAPATKPVDVPPTKSKVNEPSSMTESLSLYCQLVQRPIRIADDLYEESCSCPAWVPFCACRFLAPLSFAGL
jgi:hypothetical protein